jgi:hypothetical protein
MEEARSGSLGSATTAVDALAALQKPDPRSLLRFVGGAIAPEDRVALAIVNVEFAGCNMPFSPAISPPGVPRATSVVSVVDGALHDAPS